MSRLSEYIDRFSQESLNIRIALSKPKQHSPFTNAVLGSHLGDLIRDIDSSELGLFTLTAQDTTTPNDAPELARNEFAGPAPLKSRSKQSEEPELYARAALEYIDRFASIRPMPRAHSQASAILEQAAALRKSIQSLSDALKQQSVRVDPPSIKAQMETEQEQIHQLQAEIERMKHRRDSAKRSISSPRKFTRPKSSWAAPPAKVKRSPPKPIRTSDDEEEAFWTTPSTSKGLRISTSQKDSLLMEEDMNMADMSGSFATPMIPRIQRLEPDPEPLDADESPSPEPEQDDTISMTPRPFSPVIEPPPPAESASITPPPESSSPKASKKNKIKATIDVERIVEKICSTMGDILMPGQEKLKPKEAIAHLQELASRELAPNSPTTSVTSISISSPSSPPTAQQILTASLLVILLQAAPSHSLPLAKVKEELNARVSSSQGGLVGQNTTRILYGCVAKRLVKIDRGGGEQVVKFDI